MHGALGGPSRPLQRGLIFTRPHFSAPAPSCPHTTRALKGRSVDYSLHATCKQGMVGQQSVKHGQDDLKSQMDARREDKVPNELVKITELEEAVLEAIEANGHPKKDAKLIAEVSLPFRPTVAY